MEIGSDIGRVQKKGSKLPEQINIWNSVKLEQYNEYIRSGIKITGPCPFHENQPGFKKPELLYDYSDFEIEEFKKCQDDVLYFAETYCKTMTDDGIQNVKLYPHQKKVLRELVHPDKRFTVWTASRQSQKTSSTAFFIMWYVCFNIEKNVLVVANKADTMQEIIDKISIVYENLPFFLKPGVESKAKRRLDFDNGCRIIGQATTPNPGLGFNIHLLYCDEFAHIPSHIIEPFYRSVYPTLSASKIARIVITSTPNGRNLFYRIYNDALLGKNNYNPIKVSWWEVPGRDEEWKKRELSNLGSEASFNQEYGCQFLSTSELIVNAATLRKLEAQTIEFKELDLYQLQIIDSNNLIWHPDFDLTEIPDNKYVFSVDISDGVGGDYSIINIFRVEWMNPRDIDLITTYKDELTFLRLVQVGLFRDNGISPTNLAELLKKLMMDIFHENVLVILEINFKGELVLNTLFEKYNVPEHLLFHSYHNNMTKIKKPGVRISYNKNVFIANLSENLKYNKLEIYEKETLDEITGFGIDDKGKYTSQVGHDDLFMSCANLSVLEDTEDWFYFVEDMIENIPEDVHTAIMNKTDLNPEANKNTSDMLDLIEYVNSEANYMSGKNKNESNIYNMTKKKSNNFSLR